MADPLSFTLSRSGNTLHLAYQYENPSDHVVYLADGMVVQLKADAWRRTTGVDFERRDATTVTIAIGRDLSTMPKAVPVPGFFIPVAAHAKHVGKRDVVMPFTNPDPVTGQQIPLGDFTHVVLEIGVIETEPKWREVKNEQGQPIKFPDGPSMRLLAAPAQPIPKA